MLTLGLATVYQLVRLSMTIVLLALKNADSDEITLADTGDYLRTDHLTGAEALLIDLMREYNEA